MSSRRIGSLGLAAVLLAGCGLLIDQDPPARAGTDGGARMDGGRGGPDGGPDAGAIGCARDEDCDDGRFCTGSSYCVSGRCAPAAPVVCPDDGVPCTEERCDPDLDACVSVPDADACPDPRECGVRRCDPVAGCVIDDDDDDCDDGVDCTDDKCLGGVCAHMEVSSHCAPGSYCDATTGCQPLGTCDVARPCALSPPPCTGVVCHDGACMLTPIAADPRCAPVSTNPCEAAACVAGMCARWLVACVGDPTRCISAACTPTASGPSCTALPSPDGTPCGPRPAGACGPARCQSGSCSAPEVCTSPDPCWSYGCYGETCTALAPRYCGLHGTCVSGGGSSSCQCDPGWVDCPGGTPCTCPECGPTQADCDGDGICECDLTANTCNPTINRCVRSGCGRCDPGLICCESSGRCYAPGCLACCPAST